MNGFTPPEQMLPAQRPAGWPALDHEDQLDDLLKTLDAWGGAARADEKNFLVGGLLLRAKATIEALRERRGA